jgi:2-oxoisovalerate dehydrogenase E1 component
MKPTPNQNTRTNLGGVAAAIAEMLFIRKFEEHLLEEFSKGRLRGTTHTSIGQEAVSVACMKHVKSGDTICGSHRAHGHYLAYGGDPSKLLLEIVGHPSGICAGIGGSQHLQDRGFFTNGVQGGIAPLSLGLAFAHKIAKSGAVAICFLGDGTLGEGVVYESFNIASLWQLPILFVIEHNGIAQTTPTATALAGTMAGRAEAFGIPASEIQTSDYAELEHFFAKLFDDVRSGAPRCAIVHTQRLGPHSKGDDTRSAEQMAALAASNPLNVALAALPSAERNELETQAERRLETVIQAVEGILAVEPSKRPANDSAAISNSSSPGWWESRDATLGVDALRQAIGDAMAADSRIHLFGEDILDPYGGAFKVTRGLSTQYPDRTHPTPISEAAIVGLAGGMALVGLRPVVELMFGDFVTLAMDQIVNYVAKYRIMYGGKVSCPLILRLPMGGYRGYGPTHSQSLEKLLIGVPGIVVLALSPLHDPIQLWNNTLSLQDPVIFIENKALYGQRMRSVMGDRTGPFRVTSSGDAFPAFRLSLSEGRKAHAAILVYGGMTEVALSAAVNYFESRESIVDVIVVSQLNPIPVQQIASLLGDIRKIVTLEEGTLTCGWGAELTAMLVELKGEGLVARRCAAADTVIPSSREGESQVLPSLSDVLSALDQIGLR